MKTGGTVCEYGILDTPKHVLYSGLQILETSQGRWVFEGIARSICTNTRSPETMHLFRMETLLFPGPFWGQNGPFLDQDDLPASASICWRTRSAGAAKEGKDCAV